MKKKKKTLQNLARTLSAFPSEPTARARIKTEPFATDSLQNLLFPLLLFHSLSFPSPPPPHTLTLISHHFKRARFLALHAPVLRLPAHRIRYIGIDPPAHVTPPHVLERGEEENGAGPWRRDAYGTGEVLGAKRARRGWDGGVEVKRWVDGLVGGGLVGGGIEKGLVGGGGIEKGLVGEGVIEKEEKSGTWSKDWQGIRGLLEWKGGESGREIYAGSLPWD